MYIVWHCPDIKGGNCFDLQACARSTSRPCQSSSVVLPRQAATQCQWASPSPHPPPSRNHPTQQLLRG